MVPINFFQRLQFLYFFRIMSGEASEPANGMHIYDYYSMSEDNKTTEDVNLSF